MAGVERNEIRAREYREERDKAVGSSGQRKKMRDREGYAREGLERVRGSSVGVAACSGAGGWPARVLARPVGLASSLRFFFLTKGK